MARYQDYDGRWADSDEAPAPEDLGTARCYLCYLEATGKPDMTHDNHLSPERRVLRDGPIFEAHRDPTASSVLECGHTII